jgi:hypothetical protein
MHPSLVTSKTKTMGQKKHPSKPPTTTTTTANNNNTDDGITNHIPTQMDNDPFQIVLQCSGRLGKRSVWRNVWLICLLSSSLAVALNALQYYGIWSSVFSLEAHKMSGFLLSFLLGTRMKIAYSRYMEGRSSFGGVLRSCREIVQQSITFSKTRGMKQRLSGGLRLRG